MCSNGVLGPSFEALAQCRVGRWSVVPIRRGLTVLTSDGSVFFCCVVFVSWFMPDGAGTRGPGEVCRGMEEAWGSLR